MDIQKEFKKQVNKVAKLTGANANDIISVANAQFPGLIKVTKSTTEKWLSQFITQDRELTQVKDKIRKLAKSQINVLIIGETGTGKELLAQALHDARTGPFMGINCAGIHEELLEAELFGATKGAYTGCSSDRTGYFEFAKDGTLFLDEIGDMPKYLQCKLFRVIESKEIRKLGSNESIPISCRIVAATNFLDLKTDKKLFRQELYHRLAGSIIKTKPLRERREDIPLITQFYDPEDLVPAELVNLWTTDTETFPFVGNCRELKNMIEEYLAINKVD